MMDRRGEGRGHGKLKRDLHVIKELQRRKLRDSRLVYGSKSSTRSADSTQNLALGYLR